ncbi:MAG TPA: Cof-type HAD-IIB family hydrolase [Ktedonobacteraceae bacterium]|nr:Cof-type HAD-IIB family hydrolase [Ktedonobacteraceae bacterium]
MYRLLAIDLDGTLLTSLPYKHITSRTYKTLRKAADAGMVIVIATGQTLSVLQNVCAELPLSGPQIIENGAIIADIHSGFIFHEQRIPSELILPALSELRTLRLHRAYHTLHRVYVDKDTPRALNWYRPPVPPVIEVEDVANLYPLLCIKVAGIGEENTLREKRRALERIFDGKLYVAQSSFDIIELLHPEVSKGNALSVIAKDLQIKPEEIVAFGDNHNDIGMLQLAGLGVAMGNAHEEVKAAANIVTLSNAEDGVAVVIEDVVLPALI